MKVLFEYAIIHHAKRTKKDEEGGLLPKSTILKPITAVLAKDANEVTIQAAREIPAEFLDKLEEVQIAVRPF